MRSVSPRTRLWLARVVLLAGMLVLMATSGPSKPTWSAYEAVSLDQPELESEGQGNDKLLLIHIHLTGALAETSPWLELQLSASADRPISDVEVSWTNVSRPGVDAGPGWTRPPSDATYADGFLTLYAGFSAALESCIDPLEPGPKLRACDFTFQAHFHTQLPSAYTLTLMPSALLRGSVSDRPEGEIEVTASIVDAQEMVVIIEADGGP